jgi:hypothetical protein
MREQFMDLSSIHHLNSIDKLCWMGLPKLNIFEVLSPDLLHGFHKFFHNYIYKFNLTGTGQDEYNTHLHSQLQLSGDQMFLHGVLHISQMTGMAHQMLKQTHLQTIVKAPGIINRRVTRATWGALECVYLAQSPVHSDYSLQAHKTAHEEFMANQQVWIDNETWRG